MGIGSVVGTDLIVGSYIGSIFYYWFNNHDVQMKTCFTAFMGSSEYKTSVAYTVRQMRNGEFRIYRGCKPISKDLDNLPSAVKVLIEKMGLWREV